MIRKNIYICILGLFIFLYLAGSVYAITGAIGNARMVLRMENGEKLDKYILVKNVNNVSIDVEMTAVGDLKDSIKIKDQKFSLDVGAEKKAYFTITAQKEEGNTESKINIQFTPAGGKSGVGLSSTIIVITDGSSGSDSFFDDADGDSSSLKEPGSKPVSLVRDRLTAVKDNKVGLALIFTSVIFALFIAVLFVKKAMMNRPNEAPVIKPKKRVKEGE